MAASQRPEQVNIRLTRDEHDTVRALSFLQGGSLSDVLHEAVAEYLAAQRTDPDVIGALAALEARRARSTGKLTEISRKRRRQQEG